MRLYACALLAAAVVESAAAPSQPFTVDLAPPANARDFVRDWVVAHRKWGGNDGLARSASTQSLAAADSDREAPNGTPPPQHRSSISINPY